jgi:hypothetical protein
MTTLVQHKLPAFWVGYLMYGDATGLTDEELAVVKDWQANHIDSKPRACEDVSFGRFNGQLCELLTFTWA